MTLIALVDAKRGIAKDGKQILTIPDDMRRFCTLTMGHTVVMGRKTYEAIGHPLEGRRNIVISRSMRDAPGIDVIRNIYDVTLFDEPIYIIGGESIYRRLFRYCDKSVITKVHADLGADQFIHNLDKTFGWCRRYAGDHQKYQDIEFSFDIYERRT